MCKLCSQVIPEDAFADKMVGILNGAANALMISIGHQTGLFDTLASMDYADSEEIADSANLNERYVREWLNAMARCKENIK